MCYPARFLIISLIAGENNISKSGETHNQRNHQKEKRIVHNPQTPV